MARSDLNDFIYQALFNWVHVRKKSFEIGTIAKINALNVMPRMPT